MGWPAFSVMFMLEMLLDVGVKMAGGYKVDLLIRFKRKDKPKG